jgi:hypothetical protein
LAPKQKMRIYNHPVKLFNYFSPTLGPQNNQKNASIEENNIE